MTKSIYAFKVALKLQAPIMTQKAGAVGLGADAAMLRDERGRPCLPGSLIKGNLKHVWQQLNDMCQQPTADQINHWLGPPADKDQAGQVKGSYAPLRGVLVFDPLWPDQRWQASPDSTGHRYRIAIDERTGTVEHGALQVIESPYALGTQVTFSGTIKAYVDKTQIETLERFLSKGFALIGAMGAYKGQGFGRCVGASMTRAEMQPATAGTVTAGRQRYGLRIKPDAPICFAKPAVGENNHFEAETFIPGGAIIGAIAHRLENADADRWPTLRRCLSGIRVSHALPVNRGAKQRPVAIPLSYVKTQIGGTGKAKHSRFQNIVAMTGTDLVNGQAPTFLVDWKDVDFADVNAFLNPTSDLSRQKKMLTIRTAIEADSGRAKKGQLFSMEQVSPEGYDWLANLDVSEIGPADDRNEVMAELVELLATPLSHLGKTKASAHVVMEDEAYAYTRPGTPFNGEKRFEIYLQSPARLLPTGFTAKGTNDGDTLHQHYQRAWHTLSGGALELSHFYAQQRLLGGRYWWGRFRTPDSANAGKPYHPELFTLPGSVFVFDVVDPQQTQMLLNAWQTLGLPQLADAPGGEDWRFNPWIRTNGYGEIAVNLDIPRLEKEG